MAHNSTAKVDQKEYLKKYLSGDKSKKKKKKKEKDKEKKHKTKPDGRIQIIDDDATAFQGEVHSDEETFLYGEDAPQIVGEYIETKPNGDAASKWKSITGEEKVQVKQKEEEDRWGKKIKEEYPLSVKREATPDISPVRKGKNERNFGSDIEKPKRWSKDPKRQDDTPDQSPPRQRRQKMNGSGANGALRGFSPRHRQHSVDQSPPRKRKNSLSPRGHNDLAVPPNPRRRDSDQSPPRRRDMRQSPLRRCRESLDRSPRRRGQLSPPKHQKNRFSPNHSPVRQNVTSADLSPARRVKHSSKVQGNDRRTPPDLSPPRRRRSCTPPNRGRHHFNNYKSRGFSPTSHRQRQRSRSFDRARNSNTWSFNGTRRENPSNPFTQKRISGRNGSNPLEKGHMSPPRKRDDLIRKYSPSRESFRNNAGSDRRESSTGRSVSRRRGTSDQSPQRRRQSSPRHEKRWVSPSPAHSNHSNRSQMPPQRTTIHWETAAMVAERKAQQAPRHASGSPPPTHKPKATKTLDGKKAGLQDARALKEETVARRHDEEKMYAKMSNELSGRDAEVQVRSTGRRGRRAREAKDEDPEKRRRKEEREQERKEQYDRWGKGLKQIEDHRARLAEQEYESSKPLARYADDEDLDRHLREQERAEDPMLEYMRRKRKDKEKKSGTKVKAPVYEGSYPENRFGIRPGHRWDGVDRSNGYEKKWFDVQNEKRAVQEDAYKYSVEDM